VEEEEEEVEEEVAQPVLTIGTSRLRFRFHRN
jgi:hypothetical protein